MTETAATARRTNTGTTCEIIEVTGPRRSGPPPHTHPWNEAYYVLAGEVEITTGEEIRTFGPGSFVYVPARMIHAYRIVSDGARFLTITDPPDASRFFEYLGDRAGADEVAGQDAEAWPFSTASNATSRVRGAGASPPFQRSR